MANLDLLIKAWDEALWEFTLVFNGLSDEDVWRRPSPQLLSIGELTAHVCYYEAVMTTDPAPTPKGSIDQIPIKSILIDPRFDYYTTNVDDAIVVDMGAQDLLGELKRIHAEAKAEATKVPRDSDDPIGGRENSTWGGYIQYLGFHAAYHAGQAYSVRHFFGHKTEDN